jgi:hypothetical protein
VAPEATAVRANPLAYVFAEVAIAGAAYVIPAIMYILTKLPADILDAAIAGTIMKLFSAEKLLFTAVELITVPDVKTVRATILTSKI